MEYNEKPAECGEVKNHMPERPADQEEKPMKKKISKKIIGIVVGAVGAVGAGAYALTKVFKKSDSGEDLDLDVQDSGGDDAADADDGFVDF